MYDYRIVPLGNSAVLVNRRRDGKLEVSEDLIFHGGSGATLEMREFGVTELRTRLLAAGFGEVYFFVENVPEIGILFDHDVSQPLIARKQRFFMDTAARAQIIDLWRAAEHRAAQERQRADLLATQIHLASQSRWLRVGRTFGLGPKFA